ncbi:hypothetical protein C4K17_2133 [Pseudomonas chlororaphis subsp. aurantiaca]|nr:hypothetical protein C4K17_2133 [Pseudomonas chlororaphis subsp. aurantiaca]
MPVATGSYGAREVIRERPFSAKSSRLGGIKIRPLFPFSFPMFLFPRGQGVTSFHAQRLNQPTLFQASQQQ